MTEQNTQVEKEIHEIFDVTLFLKAIHAGIEIITGFLLYITKPEYILNIFYFFIRGEISEDPHDAVANYVAHLAQSLAINSKTFTALYLVSHGFINAFIVFNLYKEKLWAYPVGFSILGVFGLYQMYEFLLTHSAILVLLTILDIIIMILVWHEYGVVKNKIQK